MIVHLKIIASIAGALLFVAPCRSEEILTRSQVEVKDLPHALPLPIRMRAERAKLQEPEFKRAMAEIRGLPIDTLDIDADPAGGLSVVRSSDGTLHLLDHRAMALWVWHAETWKCLFSGLHINKTFGGAPPGLPVMYLGKGFFAFAETAPGRTNEKNGPFPQAFAITYLLDSRAERIVERTESYIYDQNPPLKIDPAWAAKYQLPTLVDSPIHPTPDH